jgi:hypothetical protein
MKLLATLFLLTLSMNSFADQCQYVTAESATTATKLISLSKKNSGGVLNLCQNCGEKTPTEIRVNQIDISSTGVTEAPAEVSVNGVGIDLAYTYVNISAGTWVNLGKLSNCPVTGASEFITEKKSSDGRVQYIPSAKY